MPIEVVKAVPSRELDVERLGRYKPSDLEDGALRFAASALDDEDATLRLEDAVSAMVARQILTLRFRDGEAIWQPVVALVRRAVELDVEKATRAANGQDDLFELTTDPCHIDAATLAQMEDYHPDKGPNARLRRFIEHGDKGILRAARRARVRPVNPFDVTAQPVEHDQEAIRRSITGYGSAYQVVRDNRGRIARRTDGKSTGTIESVEQNLRVLAQRPEDVAILVRSLANSAFAQELADRTSRIVTVASGWGRG